MSRLNSTLLQKLEIPGMVQLCVSYLCINCPACVNANDLGDNYVKRSKCSICCKNEPCYITRELSSQYTSRKNDFFIDCSTCGRITKSH